MAYAKEPEKRNNPVQIRNDIDLPITIGALSVTTIPVLFEKEQPVRTQAAYDKHKVFFLDRHVTSYHSQFFKSTSTVLAFGIPAMTLLASLPWTKDKLWSETYEDILLIAQAMALTSFTNQLVRHSFERPRPYMYQDDATRRRNSREDHNSFFSGHAAAVFASSVTYLRLHAARHPEMSYYNNIIGVTALSASAAMGVARVLAGDHFWTDVLTGSVVGCSIGYLVPEFHLKKGTDAGVISLQSLAPGYVSASMRF